MMPEERRTELSLVLPVYNEEESLRPLHEEIRAAVAPLGRPWEVLYVDDGSTDGSAAVLAGLARRDPEVRVLRLRRNSGQTAAFDAGFQAARGEIIVTLDADGQNPPENIPKLLAAMEEGVDAAVGYRVGRADSAWRKIQSRIANGIRNRLSGESIRDTGCSLKAFRAEQLRAVPLFDGMHRFLPTLARLQGARRVVEVPVTHRPRERGVSKYGMWNRAFRSFVDLLAVRWMRKRHLDYEVDPR
jgi:glycosyltransferase involved in cell wall biosynthesis